MEQLILTTTKAGAGDYVTPDGRPAIVTDAAIRLLFDMQAEVDAISGGQGRRLTFQPCFSRSRKSARKARRLRAALLRVQASPFFGFD